MLRSPHSMQFVCSVHQHVVRTGANMADTGSLEGLKLQKLKEHLQSFSFLDFNFKIRPLWLVPLKKLIFAWKCCSSVRRSITYCHLRSIVLIKGFKKTQQSFALLCRFVLIWNGSTLEILEICQHKHKPDQMISSLSLHWCERVFGWTFVFSDKKWSCSCNLFSKLWRQLTFLTTMKRTISAKTDRQ